MTDALLRERHMLVVEDGFLLASELCRALEQAGATIVGPVPDLPAALDLIASAPVVQGAILDVNLRGQMVFPAADMLIERNLPFLFATGYDQAVIPPRFCHVLRLEKPIATAEAVRALTGILL